MNNISDHITYAEATKSQTATRKNIKNIPNEEELANMKLLAEKCFEPLRNWLGKPIAITSFFRSARLNKAIGGSATSQHCKGQAMDIDADIFGGITNIEIFNWLRERVNFDQLIAEGWNEKTQDYKWVHVSYDPVRNRKQCLKAKFSNGKVSYGII